MQQHARDAHKHFVSKIAGFLRTFAEARRAKLDQLTWLNGPRRKLPLVWREKPRAAKCVARTKHLERDAALARHERFDRHLAFGGEVKMISPTALMKDRLVRAVTLQRGALVEE